MAGDAITFDADSRKGALLGVIIYVALGLLATIFFVFLIAAFS